MKEIKIVVIDYGAGNLQSVLFALKRLGYKGILSCNSEEIMDSDKVIFPGVGHASSAMEKIKETGLDLVIKSLKQPVLGICLGMQLMCKFSEEGNTKGLGIFDTEVKRFDESNKIPQIGWNTLTNLKTNLYKGIEEGAYVYFVHSYYVPFSASTIATVNYGIDYSASLNKKNFYGCQFHPEKSGDIGEQILKNFIEL